MKGRFRSATCVTLMACAILAVGASRAFAYSYDGQRFVYNVNSCYYSSSIPSSWNTALSNARATWNSAGSPFRINYASGAANVIYASALGSNGIPASTTHTVHPNPSQPKLHSSAAIRFNNYYPWSTSGESGKFDVQNIGTHELGHWLCLLDMYSGADAEKTMYGYAGAGETKKRSLASDDINGINRIY